MAAVLILQSVLTVKRDIFIEAILLVTLKNYVKHL